MDLNINTETVELNDYAPIPEGWYPVQIEEESSKPTQRGGVQLSYKLNIIGDKFQGRKLFTSFNLICPGSPQAEEIARKQLAQLGKACGIVDLRDSKDLLFKTCQVHAVIDEYEDKQRNRVTGYNYYQGTTPSPSTSEPKQKQWFED